jgi:hypothetical protein
MIPPVLHLEVISDSDSDSDSDWFSEDMDAGFEPEDEHSEDIAYSFRALSYDLASSVANEMDFALTIGGPLWPRGIWPVNSPLIVITNPSEFEKEHTAKLRR